jgi:hypothetical protein
MNYCILQYGGIGHMIRLAIVCLVTVPENLLSRTRGQTMKIHYDPLLTETVVLQQITRRQEIGDPALFREYRVAAGRVQLFLSCLAGQTGRG